VVKAPDTEEPLHAVTREPSLVLDTSGRLDLKVDKCHFNAVPKFGFTNPNRVAYKGINLDTLQELIDRKSLSEITHELLVENGLAQKKDLIKVLGRGELKSGIKISAHKFSATAQAAIKAAGGSTENIQ